MAHNHHHRVRLIPPEKNYKLYLNVAHTGALFMVISTVLMIVADSHAAFGDVVHGVADVATVYLMARISYLCHEGKISPPEFNFLVGKLNTVLLFAAAGGVLVEVLSVHRENTPIAMMLTGLATYIGNKKQHDMMHEAHGHEHHGPTGISGFGSILQHIIVDKIFSASVIVVAMWIQFQLPYYENADTITAWGLFGLLVGYGTKNLIDIRNGKSVGLH